MIRHLALFACLTVLGSACGEKTARDLDARVGALEARYHTQAREIKEMQEDIARLKKKAGLEITEEEAPPEPAPETEETPEP